jgi:SpoVK/Ycf46/Vps4 family AAA+-type ATPase
VGLSRHQVLTSNILLGIDPANLEKNLSKSFSRAEAWNAIVLIDEADIYLEQRTSQTPLDKQSMVAVFIRTLEYFRGIIFLTTNRFLIFDDAIISRAALIFEFPEPTMEQKQNIRRRRLDKLADNPRYKFTEGAREEYMKLDSDTDHRWTGRDIGAGESPPSDFLYRLLIAQ